jgi:hypothetical protein
MPRPRPNLPKLNPEPVAPDDLEFDPRNPRTAGNDAHARESELLKILWQQFAVDEIALSIAHNGFFKHEPLFATREDGKLRVIEGNRRLAAVKLLLDGELRQQVGATDLPKLTAEGRADLKTLPVIVCSRKDVWQYLGFKHVNGPQNWDADSKAEYIAWVHNTLRVPLPDIAETIGDKNQTVERLYRARMVLEQAEHARVFNREDRWKKHFSFSHLYTGLGYAGVRKFIGLADGESDQKEQVKKSKLPLLGEMLTWMYGSKKKNEQPIIQSQNPDLRLLDEVLQSDDGVVALRRGLPLTVSVDIARGDRRLFREALQAAKQDLQRALGTMLTGYSGEPDLLVTCQEVVQIAEKLEREMAAKHDEGGRSVKSSTRSSAR